MATKAKYYVDDKRKDEPWLAALTGTEGSWRGAVRNAVYWGRAYGRDSRIRYKGRIVAQWVNGRRVPQERGQ